MTLHEDNISKVKLELHRRQLYNFSNLILQAPSLLSDLTKSLQNVMMSFNITKLLDKRSLPAELGCDSQRHFLLFFSNKTVYYRTFQLDCKKGESGLQTWDFSNGRIVPKLSIGFLVGPEVLNACFIPLDSNKTVSYYRVCVEYSV